MIMQIPKLSVLSGTNITRIIPEPYETHLFNGFYKIPDDLSICISNDVPSSEIVSSYFTKVFDEHTKRQSKVTTCKDENNYQVRIKFDESIINEGYNLTVDEKGVTVKASSLPGFFYASNSLDQLIEKDLSINYLKINDFPRFAHRGLMLDVCRHFFPIPTIKFILTKMAYYKLNVLHWHLTEDQGWRLEIKKYPKLTEIGSKRAASPVIFNRSQLDNVPYGPYFYTQEEVKSLIQYAHNLHIEIIPEIEMPGHSIAALSAYPQYSCTGGPFEPRCKWGIEEEVYCAGNDDTIRFLEDIIDETASIFDSKYFHIGGDECPKDRWSKCPKCQKRIKDNNLKDENELQSWFMKHFVDHLSKKGKKAICWDDVINDTVIDKETIVMTWHDPSIAVKATSQGHKVIMCPTSSLYFDFAQNVQDPYEYIGGFTTLKKVYSYNPSEGFPPENEKLILGAQANLWTEHIHTNEELLWKTFPRLLALSEVVWTPNEKKSWDIFEKKLKYKHTNKLKREGVDPAPTDLMHVAEWKCEGKGTWEKNNWTITQTCPRPGKFSVDFTFLEGGRTQIKNIEIMNEGEIVGSDNHLSFIGPKNNITMNYKIEVVKKQRFTEVFLLGQLKCKKPSHGKIYMDYSYKVAESLDQDVIF